MAATAHALSSYQSEIDADHLSHRDFQRIAALVVDTVGIKMPPTKRVMLEGRLRRRLRSLGIADFAAYAARLFEAGGMEDEYEFLINAVTTNKTDFYREPEHFELMERRLLPELIEKRRGERTPLIKVWSAAASNGAEAYTAAMLMSDMAAQRNDFRFAILGTDVSTEVLAQAERAVYSEETIAPVPAAQQGRYLMRARHPSIRPEVRIVPEVRRHVRFAHLNLMDKDYPFDRDVDLIFLRNVLIYFEKDDQAAVINRLVGHLRPGGYLLLGHSESMIACTNAMRQVAPAVFQKV